MEARIGIETSIAQFQKTPNKMKMVTVFVVIAAVAAGWSAHRMRRTDSYEYETGRQAAPCGPIVVRLMPAGHVADDVVFGHTTNGDPYELKIWCGEQYKIDAVDNLKLSAPDGSQESVAPSEAREPDTAKIPVPWYFGLNERLHLKYTDYVVAFRLSVEDKTGEKQEQEVSLLLKRHYTSTWSNDIWNGLLSE